MIITKIRIHNLWSGLLVAILAGLLVIAKPTLAVENPEFLNPEYLSQVFQGDFSNIEEFLESRATTENDKVLLEKVRARFIARTDGLNLEGEDPLVRKVGKRYQEYWRDAMLDPGQRDRLEKALASDIIKILRAEGIGGWGGLSSSNYKNHLSKAFEKRGYYGIFGRTVPLLEFMVWKKNGKKIHKVELTDGVYEFEVNYLNDFVSMGWASFATFGGPATGGWATKEGLFVVTPRWELDSEAFKVSYFMHEGRHFADYKKYPNLEQPDLEYRAKLTELVYAVEDRMRVLTLFTRHAAKIDNAPHPLANWHVINDLTRELLDGNWPDDPEIWSEIPVENIQAAARKLLDQHNQRLLEEGARTTKGIIRP